MLTTFPKCFGQYKKDEECRTCWALRVCRKEYYKIKNFEGKFYSK